MEVEGRAPLAEYFQAGESECIVVLVSLSHSHFSPSVTIYHTPSVTPHPPPHILSFPRMYHRILNVLLCVQRTLEHELIVAFGPLVTQGETLSPLP